jgi:hypothetical protein
VHQAAHECWQVALVGERQRAEGELRELGLERFGQLNFTERADHRQQQRALG